MIIYVYIYISICMYIYIHILYIYIYVCIYIYRTKRWEFGNGTICHQTCGLTRTNGDIVGICWGYNGDIVGISGIYITNRWVCSKTGYTVSSINGIFWWGKLWHKNLKKIIIWGTLLSDKPWWFGMWNDHEWPPEGTYPLVNQHSYWTWPFIVDFPIKNGDFP